MSVYRTRTFSRWARKQRLSDAALCDAVHEMRHGLYEADLGGGLLKMAKAESADELTEVKCNGEEAVKDS